jgi:hypothetical protein
MHAVKRHASKERVGLSALCEQLLCCIAMTALESCVLPPWLEVQLSVVKPHP